MNEKEQLIMALSQLHTTKLGMERIHKNIGCAYEEGVAWCKHAILDEHSRCMRKGKNYYVDYEDCCITINAHSFTIITAHRYVKRK